MSDTLNTRICWLFAWLATASPAWAEPETPDRISRTVGAITSVWTDAHTQTSAIPPDASPTGSQHFSFPDTPHEAPSPDAATAVPTLYLLSSVPPPGMTLINAGPFVMGSKQFEFHDYDHDIPVHTATTDAIYMDVYEVTAARWEEVRTWAIPRGYSDLRKGLAGYAPDQTIGSNHPVVNVSWYDCVKWCNARSEKEGLSPFYYADASQLNIYRTGLFTGGVECLDRSANGYRLPTETEWEKACRGKMTGYNYPWGDSIDGAKANYQGSGDPFDDGTTPAGYYDGRQIINGERSPHDMANGYGLYDMAGNVYEWCWDWYGAVPPESAVNPLGPPRGKYRILRGGCWKSAMTGCLSCSYRYYLAPHGDGNTAGFRCVRGL
ncbi:MAG: SUMF1/EgtB/PvdO family nonheme iron enzyme [Lentisphaerae bacterium]|nr:SUMF1/EgtB/PvdO family nonheme iron enzyme [Lentisphaerota bacterium]